MSDDEGASPLEQLMYAAKTDSEEMATIALESDKLGDVNALDGLGMTALHYAAKGPSPDVLELILEYEGTDVDPQNRSDGDTPLHLAAKLDNEEARTWMCKSLLEAGADPRIQNKHKEKPIDLLPKDATELRADFKRAEAEMSIEASDIARDDASEDGESGGESGEE